MVEGGRQEGRRGRDVGASPVCCRRGLGACDDFLCSFFLYNFFLNIFLLSFYAEPQIGYWIDRTLLNSYYPELIVGTRNEI
jgi:hypothetical protein